MNDQSFGVVDLPRKRGLRGNENLIGQRLLEAGAIDGPQIAQALELQLRARAPIGEILVANGHTDDHSVAAEVAEQRRIPVVDLEREPPNPILCRRVPHELWLRHRVIAWTDAAEGTLIATNRPEAFDAIKDVLALHFPRPRPVLATERQILEAIARVYGPTLAQSAVTRAPERMSCRNWKRGGQWYAKAALAGVAVALIVHPVAMWLVLSILSLVALFLFTTFRLAALVGHILPRPVPPDRSPPRDVRWPLVSMLVPLYREAQISGTLIRRLCKLSYPRALLDIVLVLEQDDEITRTALEAADLPPWMRVIEVPAAGDITTKPRALNYALDFCRGEIIGVWDAEDEPVPNQIETIVERFAQAPPEVACLQGILDYYNPRTNWLSRCFAIEYAAWFRVLLPGVARLGLVVPLGGTTFFIRRAALDRLGAWDAHNVTEDADLGVRLYRAGYRTEMVDTVTYEEATCRTAAWIRQRSRWLKGFIITYLVHMRKPGRLWAELGAMRFLGVQGFFLGTIGQFLLTPFLWSYWLLYLGLPHPVATLLSPDIAIWIVVSLLGVEAMNAAIHAVAVAPRPRRFLLPFIASMPFYFPLGTIAMLKAVGELAFRPFFWDKTSHGQTTQDPEHQAQFERLT